MDRVLDFIESSAFGASSQFFVNSFNLASGGAYPSTPAILDIDVPVTETFTAEYRFAANQLPEDFSDPVNRHILLSVTDAAGACGTLLLSRTGIAYTGAVSFDGGTGEASFDHVLTPTGSTVEERSLTVLPGSNEWFAEGQDVYLRFIVDWENDLAYIYLTPSVDVAPGVGGADSTGHILRALIPIIPAATASSAPIDRAVISVRGTVEDEAQLELFHYNLTERLLIPNLPPRAIVGADQAVRRCSIIQLDGSHSFDPEGFPLAFEWRLVDAPNTSQVVGLAGDAYTVPDSPPTGFTAQLFSPELGTLHGLEPILSGDVVLVAGVPYSISAVKAEETPGDFYVLITRVQLPDNLTASSAKLIRQAGVSGAQTEKPTYYPDVPGFYLFDLRVFDGAQWSTPNGLQRAVTVVNVLESPLPRGCVPKLDFVFDYLPDFWALVEDKEKVAVFWGALAQACATELYTLWQYEYSKSIRDIQRTLVRRWLHYDTVLGEPVPELTKLFPVWSGVATAPFTKLFVNNRRFSFISPLFAEERVITFSGLDPVDPDEFASGFERELRKLHPSFTVDVITLADASMQLRVFAQFPFTLTAQSSQPFVPGTLNGTIAGTGQVSAPRTFKVDCSLQGIDLVEAFLTLNERAYVIERVINVAGDQYPYQRVVVKEALDTDVGDEPFVISGWVSSELLDFYRGLVSGGDCVDIEVVEDTPDVAEASQFLLLVETVAYGASKTFPSRLPINFGPIGPYLAQENVHVRLARVLRRTHLPIDALILDVPVLQEHVVLEDDAATLRRNLDFFIEEFRGQNSLRFVSGYLGGPDVFEGQRPPMRLWAEYTYVDNRPAIEENFGLLVDLRAEELAEIAPNTDYLSAVSGLMYAYTNGPTLRNLRVGTQILLGLPFAEEDGVIEEIREDLLSDNGRLLIRDAENSEIVRAYPYPKVLDLELNPLTGAPYAVGDHVAKFAPLVTGVEVIDYVKDPTWFRGLVNQGVFVEVQKYHTFVVRVGADAFDLNSLSFVQRFILRIKPNVTTPKFIVSLAASKEDGDEVSVNDTVIRRGHLTLEDGICSLYGASYIFDQTWPGGGQAWEGDSGNNHNRAYRNRADHDDYPFTVPTYPVPEDVEWGLDKGTLLCPTDDVTAEFCQIFPDPFTPTLDSVFAFDTGVLEKFSGETAGPIVIPAGASGLSLTLVDAVSEHTGTLVQLRLALMGVFTGAETAYQVVLSVNGTDEFVGAFTAGLVNQELILAVSVPIVAADTIGVRLRTTAQVGDAPGWSTARVSIANEFPWTVDDTLDAGEYCGLREAE